MCPGRTKECPVRTRVCPVRPKECPVRPKECPVRPKACPVRTTECPVRTKVCPVRAKVCPVRPRVCPVRAKERPVRTKVCSVRTKERPVRPRERPVRTKVCSVRTKERPVRTKERPVRTKERPVRTKVRPVRTKERPVRTKVCPVRTKLRPVYPKLRPVCPRQRPVRAERSAGRVAAGVALTWGTPFHPTAAEDPMRRFALPMLMFAAAAAPAPALAQGTQGDFYVHSFRFQSGEVLDSLRLHYTTLGTPRRDARGVVRNAVMVLHGTGGTGRGFLADHFAGVLFGPGELLDTAKYYVILPDNIGHGGSSKPSDGLHARFPSYTYDDMIRGQYLLLTEHLHVNHLRLIMGTSMGCMHAWVWGYTHPDFMDGLVPLACAPTQIAGRNRMMRTMVMDDIRDDPAWKGGDYTTEPQAGLRAALDVLYLMVSAPLLQQHDAPTRDAADSVIRAYVDHGLRTMDANDEWYAFNSSRNYDPAPHMAEITAPVLAINSTDDEVNPQELNAQLIAPFIARAKQVRFIEVPLGPDTHGHSTHSYPAVWGHYLAEFLATLPER